jgi:membrane dipeptidase
VQKEISPEALALHERSLVIDGVIVAPSAEWALDNMHAGGVNAGNWSIATHSENHLAAMLQMEAMRWLLARAPEKATLALSAADIEKAYREGRFAVVMGFQTGTPLEQEFHLLSILWRLGLRILQFTYNTRTPLADGCLEPENRGLTHFGIQIVRDCNRLGILLDAAHASHRSAMDMVEISKDPIHISHAGVYSLKPNPRNVRDELIKAVAAKGGVVCVAGFSDFVGDTTEGRWPTVEDMLNHIDYIVELVGVDHVGIGSDILQLGAAPSWDNGTLRKYPEICGGMTIERHHVQGLPDHKAFPRITDGLLRRGYPETDVQKIIGLNLLRLYRQVWRG